MDGFISWDTLCSRLSDIREVYIDSDLETTLVCKNNFFVPASVLSVNLFQTVKTTNTQDLLPYQPSFWYQGHIYALISVRSRRCVDFVLSCKTIIPLEMIGEEQGGYNDETTEIAKWVYSKATNVNIHCGWDVLKHIRDVLRHVSRNLFIVVIYYHDSTVVDALQQALIERDLHVRQLSMIAVKPTHMPGLLTVS
jgi:hypothetical protein